MNWNSVCADCHTTAFEKRYDVRRDAYASTFSELGVGCEACHGPAKRHAEMMKLGASAKDGRLESKTARAVDVCGRCHGRRSRIQSGPHRRGPIGDHYRVERLHGPLYGIDGQIDDEVFEYGSFLQSKMYRAGMTCVSCHEPHTGGLRKPVSALCTGCHDAIQYDGPGHHRHAQNGEGARCVSCHMAARTYLQVDVRHDHSFRIPRPDLSETFGVPNACGPCHVDRGPAWADRQIRGWTGREPSPPTPAAVEALTRADRRDPRAERSLLAVMADPAQPAIVRATAADRIRPFLREDTVGALVVHLSDESDLIRAAVVGALEDAPAQERYGHPPIYVTENGAALVDPPVTPDGRVKDMVRVNYLQGHLKAIHAAMAEGVDVRGYMVWSLLDNLEWSLGFSKRFGIVRVDYDTLARIPKDSAHYYSAVVATNGRALNQPPSAILSDRFP